MTLPALTLLLCLTCGAHAATVYRCGPNGNVFSDLPCVGAQVFEVSDARSEAQRADGLRVAALERRLGNELQRERLRQEAVAPTLAAGINGRPTPPVAALPVVQERRKHKRPSKASHQTDPRGDFVALAPARPRPR